MHNFELVLTKSVQILLHNFYDPPEKKKKYFLIFLELV